MIDAMVVTNIMDKSNGHIKSLLWKVETKQIQTGRALKMLE